MASMKSKTGLFLLLALPAFAPMGIRAQTTIYVDGIHGSDANSGTSPSAAVKTLGKGVSLVSTGGTVRVLPADYSESVTIAKSLTLEGAGPHVTRNSLNSGTTFKIQARDVTLRKIGLFVGGNAQGDVPLVLETGATGATLDDLVLRGGRVGLQVGACPDLLLEGSNLGGGGQIHAVLVKGDADRVTIRGCTFSNLRGTAVAADPGTGAILEGWAIQGCTFLNHQPPAASPGACLEMPRVKGLLVERCDFSGFLATALSFSLPGRASSGTEPPPTDLVIRDNRFHHSFGGTTSAGKGVITFRWGLSHLDLSGNRFEHTRDASGVYFEAAPGAAWQVFERIRIFGNTFAGLSGNYKGNTPGTYDADGVTIEGAGTGQWDFTNILRSNKFLGNAGYGVRNTGSVQADARWNWWGAQGGPSAPGGDGVSGKVDATSPLSWPGTLAVRSWDLAGRPAAVLPVDLDGKNGPDLVTASYDTGKVEILLSDGKGGFLPPSTLSVGRTPCRLAAGDFDGDGDSDVAVANTNDGTISILTNTRGALAVTATLNCGVPVVALAAGKVGTDSRDDLVAAVSRTPFLAGKVLYFDHASGTPSVVGGLSDPTCLALADMDGDGDLDLVTLQLGSSPGIYLSPNNSGVLGGTPAGPFSLGVSSPIQADLVVRDLDRDGNIDVVAGLTPMISLPLKPSEVRILFGAKGLSLQAGANYYTGTGFLKIALGDTTGNGFADILVADLARGTVTALEDLNPTQRTFTRTFPFCPSAAPRGIAAADLDGDGGDEALVTSFATQDISASSFTARPDVVLFGMGCPGANGTPSIEAKGKPTLGNLAFQVGLKSAPAWSAGILLASPSLKGTLEVGPCQVVLLGPAVPGFAGTGAQGEAYLPMPIPMEPSLMGATAYFQWFVLDKKGLLGPGYYSSTPGLRLKVGR